MSKNVKPTISEKINKLESSVDWFYGEDFNLDQATEKYQSAIKLAKEIEADLNGLKNKIEILNADFTKE